MIPSAFGTFAVLRNCCELLSQCVASNGSKEEDCWDPFEPQRIPVVNILSQTAKPQIDLERSLAQLAEVVREVFSPEASEASWSGIISEMRASASTPAADIISSSHPAYRQLTFLLSLPDRLASVRGVIFSPEVEAVTSSTEGRQKYEVSLILKLVNSICGESFDIPCRTVLWFVIVEAVRRRSIFRAFVKALMVGRFPAKTMEELTHLTFAHLNPFAKAADDFVAEVVEQGQNEVQFLHQFLDCVASVMFTHSTQCEGSAIASAQRTVANRLFSNARVMCSMTRLTVRRLLMGIIFNNTRGDCVSCKEKCQASVVKAVCCQWNALDSELHSRTEATAVCIGNCVSYVLLCSDEKRGTDHLLHGEGLADLLGGISKRFDQSRFSNLRCDAARVATQIAQCSNVDEIPEFSEFPSALADWMRTDDENCSSHGVPPSNLPNATGNSNGNWCNILTSSGSLGYPVDPDEVVVFFEIGEKSAVGASHEISHLFLDEKGFGKQSLKDSAPVVSSLRDAFDILVNSQAQGSTHPDRTYSAVQSLPNLLEMARVTPRDRASDVSVIPSLIPLLLSSSGSDDDVVECIARCFIALPSSSFHVAAGMLQCRTLSITQTVLLWRAATVAIKRLSRILGISTSSPTKNSKPISTRLYPPIPETRHTFGDAGVVKWKSRKLLNRDSRRFENSLVDNIEPVIGLFEARDDVDAPFVVAEQLAALEELVTSLILARHVVHLVAPRLVAFLAKELRNTNREIRLQAWLVVPKTFSWWLGEMEPTSEWILAAEAVLQLRPETDDHVRIAQGIAAAHLISALQT